MTKEEELMVPRYWIKALYPGCIYKKGDIIHLKPYDAESYPHLFKKLEWYEQRKESDMPEYVKFVFDGNINYVTKIKKWLHEDEFELDEELGISGFTHCSEEDLFPNQSLLGWEPATKEEYNTFKKN